MGAWINKRDRNPTQPGEYKVTFFVNDFNDDTDEGTDFFDGYDWDTHGYRQFLCAWWEDKDLIKAEE